MELEIQKYNARLIAVFLFQYSLFIPLMAYISPTIVVAVTGIMIILLMAIKNKPFIVNTKIVITYIVMIIIICLKTLLVEETSIFFLVYFIIYAIPPAVVFLNKFDIEEFLRFSFVLAYINFFINCAGPVTPYYEYMRFGYGLLLSSVFFFIQFTHFREKLKKWQQLFCLLLFIVSSLEIAMYGARGSLFSLLIFILIDLLFIGRKNILRNVFLMSVLFAIYCNLSVILNFLLRISQKIGIYSYPLTKFIMQLEGGWEYASSGRDTIYKNAISQILEHPIIGNPVQPELEHGDYAHNIFLQVGLDLGIIGVVALVIFLIAVCVLLFSGKVDEEKKLVLAVLFAASVARLMFSSTLWQRPEFWMLVSFTIVVSDKHVTLTKRE